MPITHPIINKRGVIDSPWNAHFQGRTVGVYAHSERATLQKAIEYFQPKKRQREQVIVEPTEE